MVPKDMGLLTGGLDVIAVLRNTNVACLFSLIFPSSYVEFKKKTMSHVTIVFGLMSLLLRSLCQLKEIGLPPCHFWRFRAIVMHHEHDRSREGREAHDTGVKYYMATLTH